MNAHVRTWVFVVALAIAGVAAGRLPAQEPSRAGEARLALLLDASTGDPDPAALLALADVYRDEARTQSGAAAAEARRLEALALLHARLAGDASCADRCEALVDAVRFDPDLDPARRFEVAALFDHVDVLSRSGGVGSTEQAQGLTEVCRSLIVEFPHEAAAYEALLGRAADCADSALAAKLAREVIAFPAAPNWVQRRAQTLADRHELVGQSLDALLHEDADLLAREAGQGILIYTWARWAPESLVLAHDLAARTAPGTLILAVSLDQDVGAAQAAAFQAELPGVLLFDHRGLLGLVPLRLKFDQPGLAYVAAADGTITSVTAHVIAKASASGEEI
jgi:hypothetical protein